MSKKILRIISGVMLIIAVVFLSIALTHPELGRVFYIIYVIIMAGLFIASFYVGKENSK